MSTTTPNRPQSLSVAWYTFISVPVAVPLAVSIIPFAPGLLPTWAPFLVPKLFALGVLTAVSFAAWCVAVARNEVAFRPVAGWGWYVAFGALLLGTTLFALDPRTALFGDQAQYAGVFTWSVCGLLFFLATQLVSSPSRMRSLTRSIVLGGLLVAVVGIVQSLQVDVFRVQESASWMVLRGYSTLGNPDFTGTYYVAPLLLAVGLALADTVRGWRVFGWAAAAAVGVGLLVTLARGGWLGALAGLVALAVPAWRARSLPRRVALAAVAAGGVVVALVVSLNVDRFAARITELSSGWQTAGGSRLVAWRDALVVVSQHPLTGVGADSYRLGWYPIQSMEHLALGTDGVVNDPHSFVLSLAALFGIPAMLVGLACIGVALAKGFKSAARATDAPRLLYSAWWAALLGMSVALVFAVTSIAALTMLCLVMGTVLSAHSAPKAGRSPGRSGLAYLGLVPAAVMLAVSFMYLASDFWLARAQTGSELRHAQRALAWAPWSFEARRQVADGTARQALSALAAGQSNASLMVAEADTLTRELIETSPHESASYLLRSVFLTQLGLEGSPDRLAEALDVANEGLHREPRSLRLIARKAFLLLRLGRPAEVEEAVKPYWTLSTSPDIGVLYAEALLRSNRQAEARTVLDELGREFGSQVSDAQAAFRERLEQ